jgi:WD40 repeat protein
MSEPPKQTRSKRSTKVSGTVTAKNVAFGDNATINDTTYYNSTTVTQIGWRKNAAERAKAFEGPSPYKGMEAFQTGDADRFFGRDDTVRRLLDRFVEVTRPPLAPGAYRLLPILGPSGSGKSSVARAGLLPILGPAPAEGKLARARAQLLDRMDRRAPPGAPYRIATFTPTDEPLATLAWALATLVTDKPAPTDEADDFEKRLRAPLALTDPKAARTAAAKALDKLVRAASKGQNVLLLVDQFEEVFSRCHEKAEAQAFIEMLLDATADPDSPLTVILTMRLDFMAQTQAYNELNQVMAKTPVLVSAMSADEVRAAILQPLAAVDIDIDAAATVNALVEETVKGEAMLPLLQLMLGKIWNGMPRIDPATTYENLHGLAGVVATAADEIFKQLSEDQKKIARRAFMAMVTFNANQPTRAQALLSEMVAEGEDPKEIRAVLDAFAQPSARLVVLSSDADGELQAEVAHEALFTRWGTLKEWLDAHRDDIRFHDRVKVAAKEWHDQKRPAGSLWRPPNLHELRKYAKRAGETLSQLDREFLDASQSTHDERIRQTRIQKSKSLADAAFQLIRDDQASGAMMLALMAFPEGEIESPDYHYAEAALRAAMFNKADKRQWSYKGPACAGFSSDGALVLSGGSGYQAHSWNPVTDEERWFKEAAGPSRSLSMEPGGSRMLVTWGGGCAAICTDTDEQIELKHDDHWVVTAAFSPDGQRVVTGAFDGSARIWDAEKGQMLKSLDTEPDQVVFDACWSDEGDKVLTLAPRDKAVRVWNPETGELITRLEHDEALRAVAYSPDGMRILTVPWDGTSAFVWDAWDYSPLFRLDGHTAAIRGATFSPDGESVLTCSNDGTARLWDVRQDWERELDDEDDEDGPLGLDDEEDGENASDDDDQDVPLTLDDEGDEGAPLTLDDDGDTPAPAASRPGLLSLFRKPDRSGVAPRPKLLSLFRKDEPETASVDDEPDDDAPASDAPDEPPEWISIEAVKTFEGHDGPVTFASFGSEGRIVTASEDCTARVWGSDVCILRGHQAEVTFAGCPSSDPNVVVTASLDGTTRTWDLRKGAPTIRYQPREETEAILLAAAMSPDGARVVGAYDDGSVWIWNAKTGEVDDGFEYGGSSHAVGATGFAAISPDCRLVAFNDVNGVAVAKIGEPTKCIDRTGAEHFAFSPDGKYLAIAPRSGNSELWDLSTMTLTHTWEGEGAATFFPTGDARVFLAGFSRSVIVAENQEDISIGRTHHQRSAVSPDGKTLATTTKGVNATLWDTTTGKDRDVLQGHKKAVNDVAFSPDGDLIATASDDHTIRLWDTQLGVWLATFQPHAEPIRRVSFSAAGDAILGVTAHAAALWPLDAPRGQALRDAAMRLVGDWVFPPEDQARWAVPESPKTPLFSDEDESA